MIGKGAVGMLRGENWLLMFAFGLFCFAGSILLIALDLRPQGVFAMLNALLGTFVGGYLYRARVVSQDKPPPLGSLWLEGDPWRTDGDSD